MERVSPTTISDLMHGYAVRRLHVSEQSPRLSIDYCSLIRNPSGGFSEVAELSGSLSFDWGQLPDEVRQKLETLERVVVPFLPSYVIPVSGSIPLKVEPIVSAIFCNYYTRPPTNVPNQLSAVYYFPTATSKSTQVDLAWESLSRSQQLLVTNLASWAKRQAWEDLATKIREISEQPALINRPHKVFISHKRRSKSESVAEVVAERVSQQGISVWFDKWEIKAGDSIPGKIGEGFKDSDACLIFLSHGYSGSAWCTKEMNTALAKAINEHLTVIPCLVETCGIPELLKDLKRVDFVEPTATEFEQELGEITDAIYKVDLNPYR